MIQLIICGFITGLVCVWNYTYSKLSANPDYALQNPIVLKISTLVRNVGVPLFLLFLVYALTWSAAAYIISMVVGMAAALGAYKVGRAKGFMHFIGIIACIPLVLINGMLLYLVLRYLV